MLLLRTMHGSHLYGLNHAESDQDFYEVVTDPLRRPKQSIVNGIDTTRVSLAQFMQQASKGVPQALEAMYSQQAEVNLIAGVTSTFQPDMASTRDVYARTIVNFSKGDSFKKQRHAWRLWFNIVDLMNDGRFNPSLTTSNKELISYMMGRNITPMEVPAWNRLGFGKD